MPAELVAPTEAVRESYLSGERSHWDADGGDADWLAAAADDFAAFVAATGEVQVHWGVPYSTFWYVSGTDYLGTLVIRHYLTPDLEKVGGHIGYHVVPNHRRQGHATRMLAAGLGRARGLGLDRVLLTCSADNHPSRRTILANGGRPDGRQRGEDRFWIDLRESPSGRCRG